MPFSSSQKSVATDLETKVAGVTIDSLGRRWDAAKHPRDSRGRFIETGGIVRVGLGELGKVIRSMAGGKVEVQMADGTHRIEPHQQLTMIRRPDGSSPTMSVKKVTEEDAKRDGDSTRGDGKYKPDHGGIDVNSVSPHEQPADENDNDQAKHPVPEAYTPSRDTAKQGDMVVLTARDKQGNPQHILAKVESVDDNGHPKTIKLAGSGRVYNYDDPKIPGDRKHDTVIPREDLKDPAGLFEDGANGSKPAVLDSEEAADLVEGHAKETKYNAPSAEHQARPFTADDNPDDIGMTTGAKDGSVEFHGQKVGTIKKGSDGKFEVHDAQGNRVGKAASWDNGRGMLARHLAKQPAAPKEKPAKAAKKAAPAKPRGRGATKLVHTDDEHKGYLSQSGNLLAVKQSRGWAVYRATGKPHEGGAAQESIGGRGYEHVGDTATLEEFRNQWIGSAEDHAPDGTPHVPNGSEAPNAPEAPSAPAAPQKRETPAQKHAREWVAQHYGDDRAKLQQVADMTKAKPSIRQAARNRIAELDAQQGHREQPNAPEAPSVDSRQVSLSHVHPGGLFVSHDGKIHRIKDKHDNSNGTTTLTAEDGSTHDFHGSVPVPTEAAVRKQGIETPHAPEAPQAPGRGAADVAAADRANMEQRQAEDRAHDTALAERIGAAQSQEDLNAVEHDISQIQNAPRRHTLLDAAAKKRDELSQHDEHAPAEHNAREHADHSPAPTTPAPQGHAEGQQSPYPENSSHEGAPSHDSQQVHEPHQDVLRDVPAEQGGEAARPGEVLPPARGGNEPSSEKPVRRPGRAGSAGRDVSGQGGSADHGQEAGRGESARPDALQHEAGPGHGGQGATGAEGSGSRPSVDQGNKQGALPYTPPADAPRFQPHTQADLAPAGDYAKAEANVAALKTLRKIQAEKRPATPEEQKVLARWGGWGAAWRVFQPEKYPKYQKLHDELRSMLNDEQWRRAEHNSTNAHYTDASYVKTMWQAVKDLGFKKGKVLEPGSGSGTFMGFAPGSADVYGIELDPTSAEISQLLYPNAHVRNERFEQFKVPDNSFDLTIGNVPFGNMPFVDKESNPQKHVLHNAAIVKSIKKTRPGGLVAVLTSHHTMDASGVKGRSARQEMADHADLIGAVRLPSKAHERAAGTAVVTDMLLFRKREPGTPYAGEPFVDSTPVKIGDGEAPINAYFQQHSENVLGEYSLGGLRKDELSVQGNPDAAGAFRSAVDNVVKDANGQDRGHVEQPGTEDRPLELLNPAEHTHEGFIGEGDKVFERTLTHNADGSEKKKPEHQTTTFTQVENGVVKPFWVRGEAQKKELRSLLRLRDLTRALLTEEGRSEKDNPRIKQIRRELNNAYDAHVKKYGAINRFKWRRTGRIDKETGEEKLAKMFPPMGGFRDDPASALVYALEKFDPETGKASKASIFTQRTVSKRELATKADNPADAVALSMETHGYVDLPSIAKTLGVSQDEAFKQLHGLVFKDHTGSGKLIPREEYLSGDVRAKLKAAQQAAEEDPSLFDNVAALESVVPEDLTAGEIDGRLGAAWIGEQDVQQFLRDILQDPSVRVEHSGGSVWGVTGNKGSVTATDEWGTGRKNALDIAEKLLTGKSIVVEDTIKEDGKERRVVNAAETEAAQAKAEDMQERFSAWLWEDPERAQRLQDEYNDKFNGIVLREYATDALALPGLSKRFTLRPHQNAAIRRIVSEPSALLAHEVGAGKTLEMVGGVMELRRLGLAKKPAIVVPNHMLEQFSREFLEAYPNANILAAGSDDLKGEKRRRFVARAATGDWDAVILTHSSFEKIGMSPEHQKAYLEKQIAGIREQIAKQEARGERNSLTFKELQKILERREAKIKEKLDKLGDNKGTSFEETGIDYLMVDEAHEYKNLTRWSGRRDLAIEGSDKATDLDMKIDHLRNSNDSGRVVTFATATPIANSIGEAYTMQQYLRPDLLHKAGIDDFDTWVSTFGTTVNEMEVAPTGGFRMKERFKKFRNVPELLKMFRVAADVKTAQDLNLPVPQINNKGDAQNIIIPASEEFQDFNAQALDEAAQDDSPAAILKYITKVTQGSLDLRLVGEDGPPDKINAAAANIARIHNESKGREYPIDPKNPDAGMQPLKGSLQVVFSDAGTPNEDGRFSAYEALKEALVRDHGFDPKSIRFIHEAKNDQQKAELFNACRSGQVNVLIGSTKKMGVGTNVQDRAVALHHLDCPWRPADLQQRDGRVERQGNLNGPYDPSRGSYGNGDGIEMYRYVTEGSIDAYRWQTVKDKSVFIGQMMRGKLDVREIDDLSDQSMSLAVATALAAGNPHLLEKARADEEVKRLTRLDRKHHDSQRSLQGKVTMTQAGIAQTADRIKKYDDALGKVQGVEGDNFKAEVAGHGTFTGKKARTTAGEALSSALAAVAAEKVTGREGPEREIGKFGGFTMTAHVLNRPGEQKRLVIGLRGVPGTATDISAEVNKTTGGGVLTRMENRIEGIAARKEEDTRRLAGLKDELGRIKKRIGLESPHAGPLDDAKRKAGLLTKLIEATENTEGGEAEKRQAEANRIQKELAALNAKSEAAKASTEAEAISNDSANRDIIEPGVMEDTVRSLGMGGEHTPRERHSTSSGTSGTSGTRSGSGSGSKPAAEGDKMKVSPEDLPTVDEHPSEQQHADHSPAAEDHAPEAAAGDGGNQEPPAEQAPAAAEEPTPGEGEQATHTVTADERAANTRAMPEYGQKVTLADGRTVTMGQESLGGGWTAEDANGNTIDLTSEDLAGWKPYVEPKPEQDTALEGMNVPEQPAQEKPKAPRKPPPGRKPAGAAPSKQGALDMQDTHGDGEQPSIHDAIATNESENAAPAPESAAAQAGTRAQVTEGLAPAAHALLVNELAKMHDDSNKNVAEAARTFSEGGTLTPEQLRLLGSLFETRAEMERTQGNKKRARIWAAAGKALLDHAGEEKPAATSTEHTPEAHAPGGEHAEPTPEQVQQAEDTLGAQDAAGILGDTPADKATPEQQRELVGEAQDVQDQDQSAEGKFPEHTVAIDTGRAGGIGYATEGDATYLTGKEAYDNRKTIANVKVDGKRAFTLDASPTGSGKAWQAHGTDEQRRAALEALSKAIGGELTQDGAQAAAEGDGAKVKHPPTPQQQKIIDAFETGKDIVVRALAGTGKTSTMVMLADRMKKGQKALYVAFNKSIQEEAARKFAGKPVTVKTADALAYAALPSDSMRDKIMSGLKRPDDVARVLGITDYVKRSDGNGDLSPTELAVAAVRAVEHWAISDREKISKQDVPEALRGDANACQAVLKYARKAWNDDYTQPNGKLYFTHQHSRKMWALTNPKLNYDVIFFDEAQDANDVLAGILRPQKAQTVVVGDSNQSIYGFIGASDQLDKWDAEADLPLTVTWRCGPAIAGIGNRFLQLTGTKMRLQGNPKKDSRIVQDMENADAILTRTNAGAVAEIATELDKGKRVATAGDAKDLRRFAEAARSLVNGKRTTNPELSQFKNWNEVRDYAQQTGDTGLQTMIRLVDERGAQGLVDLLDRLVPETSNPDVVVSTAHKSKGREWPRVRIGSDFKGPEEDRKTGELRMPSDEELRLDYVAVTRAEQALDLGSLGWVYDYSDDNGGNPDEGRPMPEAEATPANSVTVDTTDMPDHEAAKIDAITGANEDTSHEPATAEPEAPVEEPTRTLSPEDVAAERESLGGLPDEQAQNERLDAIAKHAAEPQVQEHAQVAEKAYQEARDLTPTDVHWTTNDGQLVGEWQGYRIEQYVGRGKTAAKIGPNTLVKWRLYNPQGVDVTNEYWGRKTGMIPNGAKNSAEALDMVKQSFTHDLQDAATRERGLDRTQAEWAARPPLGEPDAEGRVDRPDWLPESTDPSLRNNAVAADHIRPGTRVEAFIPDPEHRTHRGGTWEPGSHEYVELHDVAGTFLGLDDHGNPVIRDDNGRIWHDGEDPSRKRPAGYPRMLDIAQFKGEQTLDEWQAERQAEREARDAEWAKYGRYLTDEERANGGPLPEHTNEPDQHDEPTGLEDVPEEDLADKPGDTQEERDRKRRERRHRHKRRNPANNVPNNGPNNMGNGVPGSLLGANPGVSDLPLGGGHKPGGGSGAGAAAGNAAAAAGGASPNGSATPNIAVGQAAVNANIAPKDMTAEQLAGAGAFYQQQFQKAIDQGDKGMAGVFMRHLTAIGNEQARRERAGQREAQAAKGPKPAATDGVMSVLSEVAGRFARGEHLADNQAGVSQVGLNKIALRKAIEKGYLVSEDTGTSNTEGGRSRLHLTDAGREQLRQGLAHGMFKADHQGQAGGGTADEVQAYLDEHANGSYPGPAPAADTMTVAPEDLPTVDGQPLEAAPQAATPAEAPGGVHPLPTTGNGATDLAKWDQLAATPEGVQVDGHHDGPGYSVRNLTANGAEVVGPDGNVVGTIERGTDKKGNPRWIAMHDGLEVGSSTEQSPYYAARNLAVKDHWKRQQAEDQAAEAARQQTEGPWQSGPFGSLSREVNGRHLTISKTGQRWHAQWTDQAKPFAGSKDKQEVIDAANAAAEEFAQGGQEAAAAPAEAGHAIPQAAESAVEDMVDERPEPLVNGVLRNPDGMILPTDSTGDYSPEQINYMADHGQQATINVGDQWHIGHFRPVEGSKTHPEYVFDEVGGQQDAPLRFTPDQLHEVRGLRQAEIPGPAVEASSLRPGTKVAFMRGGKQHAGILTGITPEGRAVVRDAMGEQHESTIGGKVRPIIGAYMPGQEPKEEAFAPEAGVWSQTADGRHVAAVPGEYVAGIAPDGQGGYRWEVRGVPGSGVGSKGGTAQSANDAKQQVDDALWMIAADQGVSRSPITTLPGDGPGQRDQKTRELTDAIGELRGLNETAPENGIEGDDTAEAPTVDGQPAGWVPTGELQPGDIARVEGDDGNGSATTRTGHVLGTPESVAVHVPGKPPAGGWTIVVGEHHDGSGDRGTVLTPEVDVTARAERDQNAGDSSNPQSAAESQILGDHIGDSVGAGANDLGVFPGSVVTDSKGRSGVVTDVTAMDVGVQWANGGKLTRTQPGMLTVDPEQQNRPEGWTKTGQKIIPGRQIVQTPEGTTGPVHDLEGDRVGIVTPDGMHYADAADVKVIGAVRDGEPTKGGVEPTFDVPASPEGLDTRAKAPIKPEPLPDGVASERPNLTPDMQRALDDLGLDHDQTSLMDVQQAAARLRHGMPISADQADALAKHLGERIDSGDLPGKDARKLKRVRNRVAASDERLRGQEPAAQEPDAAPAVATRVTDVAPGDVIALPNPATGQSEVGIVITKAPKVVREDGTTNPHVFDVTMELADGSQVTRPIADDAEVYRLPDLPRPDQPLNLGPGNEDEPFIEPRVEDRLHQAADAVTEAATPDAEQAGSLEQVAEQVNAGLDSNAEAQAQHEASKELGHSLEGSGVNPDAADGAHTAADHEAQQVAEQVAEQMRNTVEDFEPLPGESQSDAAQRWANRLRDAGNHVNYDEATQRALEQAGQPQAHPSAGEQAQAVREMRDALRADLFAFAEQLAALGDTHSANEIAAVAARLAGRPDEAQVERAVRAAAMGREPGKIRSLVARIRGMFTRARQRFLDRVKSLMGTGRKARRSLNAAVKAARAEWNGDNGEVRGIVSGAAKHLGNGGDQHVPDVPAEPTGFADRLAFWRDQLPTTPDTFGKVESRRPLYKRLTLDVLRGGRSVAPSVTAGLRLDRASDGGPGATALGHLDALNGLGRAVDDEVQSRVRAALPDLGDDPAGTVAEAHRHAADMAQQERGDLTDSELAKLRTKARADAEDKTTRYANALAQATRDVLASQRQMGPSRAARLNVQGRTETAPEVKALRWAEQHMPTDWLASAGTVEAKAGRMGGYEDNGTITVAPLTEGRVDGAGKYGASALHGLAHHMEGILPDVPVAQWAYHWSRTSNGLVPGDRKRRGRNGLGWLLDLLPGRGMTKGHGKGRAGDFPNPWAGIEHDESQHHEVLPLALESVFAGNHEHADADMRRFLLGMLTWMERNH